MSKRQRIWLSSMLGAAAVASACATDAAETAAEAGPAVRTAGASEALELPAPDHGFVVESGGVWVEAGDDVRLCEVIALPEAASPYYIGRIESALSSHSDDLIVRAAGMGSDTAAAMDPQASMPCTRAGEAFGEDLTDVLRSQGRYVDERFPEGVATVLHGAQKLAVEYHVVNETKDAVLAKAKLAFHTIDGARIRHRVRTASFENFTIYTPPNGRSSHVGECHVRQELFVSDLVRRTQRYGTSFKVWRAGGEHDGELLWESSSREESRVGIMQPLHLLPGDGFRFQCDYANPTARELRYGVSADDETCTLDAVFWLNDESRDAVAEDCLLFNVDSDGVARPHA
jgi:hypothetical protein